MIHVEFPGPASLHVSLQCSPALTRASVTQVPVVVPLVVLEGTVTHAAVPFAGKVQSVLRVQVVPGAFGPLHTRAQGESLGTSLEQAAKVACISLKQSPAACGS
jgi:hypothetical protein